VDIAVGSKFAYWTVVRHEGGARYRCRCECGTFDTLYASALKHNKNPSCGCMRRSRVPKVGDTVAEWKILRWSGPPERLAWCECSCGTKKFVEIYTLGKDSKSCGHARVATSVTPRAPGAELAAVVTNKRCTACRVVKPLDNFHRDNASADGRRPRCKECVKSYDDANQSLRNLRAREAYRADPAAKIAKTTAYRRENPAFSDLDSRIARGGGRVVGDVNPESLQQLRTRYGNACFICGVSFDLTPLHWDHFQPVSKGGDHSIDNLRPACRPCNNRKQARWPFTDAVAHEIREAVTAERNLLVSDTRNLLPPAGADSAQTEVDA